MGKAELFRSKLCINQGSHIFKKTFSNSMLFQYLFNTKFKDFNNIIQLHFPKILLMEHSAEKTSAELSSAVKKKNWIKKWLDLGFPDFCNTLCTFWPSWILFQGLENWFHNLILFRYFQYRVATLINAHVSQQTNQKGRLTPFPALDLRQNKRRLLLVPTLFFSGGPLLIIARAAIKTS